MGGSSCRDPHEHAASPGDNGREGDNGFHAATHDKQQSNVVSLKHAEETPKLAFLHWTHGRRPNHFRMPKKALEHAIRQAFYAYPVFESSRYKVHLQRQGQKQLLRDLQKVGAFDLDVHESMKDEWKWMQTVSQSYLGRALGCKVYTYTLHPPGWTNQMQTLS